MPDGSFSTVGPYLFPPPPIQIEEFLFIVKETGEPERIPGITRAPPDLSLERHELICEIHVPVGQRPGGEYIPCAICRDVPKFLHGHLLWSEDGCLRLIGHCCAHEYFQGGRFADIVDQGRRKRQRKAQEDWLLDNLEKVPDLLAEIVALQPAAGFLHKQKSAFAKEAPAVHEIFQRAFRNSAGALTVVHEQLARNHDGPRGFHSSTGGQSDYQVEIVATLRGQEFLMTGFRPISALKKLIAQLEALPGGNVLDAVAAMDEQGVDATTRMFLAALKAGPALVARLRAAALFLSPANVAGMKKWAEHPNNPLPLHIDLRSSSFRLRLDENNILLVLTSCPPMSDLKGFDIALP
ncbi:hypothetical protein SAE02_71660 [Skermanella aerolata]|uniref:Uncharacterized protein n=1 Tax=Skermanella aerolata TaxID=393310 RepID=A0A512E2R1_9PROT|nr:hypothetical protein [Skermanella aerolata]KJB90853.1 hypothetical protein N826_34235 [Skermanella aerolata KACC 11604]GEO43018.1 hypothetical protein SAE02_71660 [Skermanella aerolata]